MLKRRSDPDGLDYTWRAASKVIIGEVLADLPDDADEPMAKRSLSDAYPFGERRHFPYKVWCEEVRRALDLRYRGIKPARKRQAAEPDDNTPRLFD